ncbi:MAG: hypothetical protein ACREEA_09195, partial [Stellaceae bacterium]
LPGIEELRAAGLIGPRPDMTLSETGKLAELPVEGTEAAAAAEQAAEAEAEAEAAAEELGRGVQD